MCYNNVEKDNNINTDDNVQIIQKISKIVLHDTPLKKLLNLRTPVPAKIMCNSKLLIEPSGADVNAKCHKQNTTIAICMCWSRLNS